MPQQLTRIIAVTGTKGKTTCVRALSHAIQAVHSEPVLTVDTARLQLGDRIISKDDYMKYSGLGTAVCPGRATTLLMGQASPIAILEASVGSAHRGLGYRHHEIGIFTNVFDDHIRPTGKVTNREQLAAAKASFIFGSIAPGGTAVYNADDELIVSNLHRIPDGVNLLPVSLSDSNDITPYAMSLGGQHAPSAYNTRLVIAALKSFFRDDATKLATALKALETYSPDPDGGRLSIQTASNGTKVILDFAHEAQSLKELADFARTQTGNNGKVIGVVRLTGSRTDDALVDTSRKFVDSYDQLIIYDKNADGAVNDRPIGEVPAIILAAAKAAGVPAEIKLHRQEALEAAKAIAAPEDVIIFIVRDDGQDLATSHQIFQFKENIQ